tara:strand:+ start:74 stop:475 length:402 start_codon:yes stop_codon:yes gene_type:complete
MPRFAPVLALCLVAALPAQADEWDRLRDDPEISQGLVDFAIARDIQNRCSTISARRLRAIGFINELVNDAMELGYRRSEIRQFVFNEAEQERVGAIADERLAARGASPTMMAGYCTVGREEIAAGSAIGRLLR